MGLLKNIFYLSLYLVLPLSCGLILAHNSLEIILMIIRVVDEIFPMFSEYIYSKTFFRVKFIKDINYRYFDVLENAILHPKDLKGFDLVSLDIKKDTVYIKQRDLVVKAFNAELVKSGFVKEDFDFELVNIKTGYSQGALYLYYVVAFLSVYELTLITERVLFLILNF